MAYYGMLFLVTAISAVSIFGICLQQTSYISVISGEYAAYSSIREIDSFRIAVSSTMMPNDSLLYGSWLGAVRASAYADGLNVSDYGGALIVGTRTFPRAYAIVRLANA